MFSFLRNPGKTDFSMEKFGYYIFFSFIRFALNFIDRYVYLNKKNNYKGWKQYLGTDYSNYYQPCVRII